MVEQAGSHTPTASRLDARATQVTRARYARIAAVYDTMEALAEGRYRPWREHFWELVSQLLPPAGRPVGGGGGAGENMALLPPAGAGQALPHPDDSFDVAAATFVFCSVPDPVLGLQELRRVVRPGGAVLLMEHVRSDNPAIGRAMDLLNPLVVRLVGANINRQTVANVGKAGVLLGRGGGVGGGGGA